MKNHSLKMPISQATQLPDDADLEFVSIKKACRLLGDIARSTLYERVYDGTLKAIKLGERTLIFKESIRALLVNSPYQSKGSHDAS